MSFCKLKMSPLSQSKLGVPDLLVYIKTSASA